MWTVSRGGLTSPRLPPTDMALALPLAPPQQIPNQSSIPIAWKAFTPTDRLVPSSNRDRLVDVCEELIKTTLLLLPHRTLLDDRFSEREEKRAHGRLRTQAETEAAKALTEEAKKAVESAAKNGSETA